MNSQRTDRWRQLLSPHRVGDKKDRVCIPDGPDERTGFDKDHDRIVFSSAFRGLHEKARPFPPSPGDVPRTCFSHGIEASSVGRSLGQLVGRMLVRQGVDVDPTHLGTVVATACLARDLGQPPFGAAGEAALQHWVEQRFPRFHPEAPTGPAHPFATEGERQDLARFESPAQGFRILTRLQARNRDGGLRYTVATLGAMSRFPRPSVLPGRREWHRERVSERAFGYFQDDAQLAREVFRTLGLTEREPDVFSRHPLAFLVEAADDLCETLRGLEDLARGRLLPSEEACDLLEDVAWLRRPFRPLKDKVDLEARLGVARAGAISALIQECVAAFEAGVEALEAGRFEQPLVSARPETRERVEAITTLLRQKAEENEHVLQREAAGYQTLGGLLELFVPAVLTDVPDRRQRALRRLLPPKLFQRPGPYVEERDAAIEPLTPYQRLLCVVDHLSALSERAAVELYQHLAGFQPIPSPSP